MPINDFKPFAAGPGANVTSQADWENLPALLSGFMSGKASSAQMNKAFRQASFIAAALAQFVSEKTDQDVLDDGDLLGFVEKLTAGFAAQYLSRSDPFGDIASDGPEAIATALSNLQLGEAAKRNVGAGANQIPDMNSFLCSFASNGYMKFPGGLIVQWANAGPLVGNSSALLSFPIPFPNQLLVAVPYTGSTVAAQNLGVSLKYESRQSVTLFASTTSTSTSCGAISIGY